MTSHRPPGKCRDVCDHLMRRKNITPTSDIDENEQAVSA